MIKTRVRGDTKRQQFNTENLFDVIIRHKLQPKQNECLFILTDSDLYPQDGWTFVFGVTRPHLRTLVQSIARHDPAFPKISNFRAHQVFLTRERPEMQELSLEGGAAIFDHNKIKVKRELMVSGTDKSSFISANNEDFLKNNAEDGRSINSGFGTTAFQPESDCGQAADYNQNNYVSTVILTSE